MSFEVQGIYTHCWRTIFIDFLFTRDLKLHYTLHFLREWAAKRSFAHPYMGQDTKRHKTFDNHLCKGDSGGTASEQSVANTFKRTAKRKQWQASGWLTCTFVFQTDTAASVWLRLFIYSNEGCNPVNATLAPARVVFNFPIHRIEYDNIDRQKCTNM